MSAAGGLPGHPPQPPWKGLRIWHPGDAVAVLVALAIFAVICCGRCA